MTDELAAARNEVRRRVLDAERFVSAQAGGALRGQHPTWRRVELRPVDLRSGSHLQIVTFDERQSFTDNTPWSQATPRLDHLLAEPFGHWHVVTTEDEFAYRVSKSGRVLVTRKARGRERRTEHDKSKSRLVDPTAPFLQALQVTNSDGQVRAGKRDKYRQVEEFVRLADAAVREALSAGRLQARPLRVVDLGCGNAYLTFALHHHLHVVMALDVETVGVDVKEQARKHNVDVAHQLGWTNQMRFVEGEIATAQVEGRVDVTVALHACDTATDDALARGVSWQSDLILAAPCCHHDVQRQLASMQAPSPYGLITRHGLMRERYADLLTDALRVHLLRRSGYRADVVEFVDSKHTPRNVLIRAQRTGVGPAPEQSAEYDELVRAWGVRPRLEQLLGEEPDLPSAE
jgi:SAM-dependent methyltransferase